MNVNVNDSYESKFIFQEKFTKEFLEFNNLERSNYRNGRRIFLEYKY